MKAVVRSAATDFTPVLLNNARPPTCRSSNSELPSCLNLSSTWRARSQHQKQQTRQVHLLPCKVHADRPANVPKYFLITDMLDGTKEASFRGRHLKGTPLPVPVSYSVVTLAAPNVASPVSAPRHRDDDDDMHDDMGDDDVSSTASASTVTLRAHNYALAPVIVWDHDQLPNVHTSGALQAMAWCRLAEAVHAPVDMVAQLPVPPTVEARAA
ncbi:hypothetical protein AMAG_17734 [Allomyces macrogynus ATCC 38327]|uniref:Uncharacterized protein n=1 Tax=Allomyces macrogynus (strain ATCC 38327) TaxID=578462 RepID=A0A0L0RXK3_ALLM3|nr:hypothetical protein AMAG_17734 [Allomyces macrogynus ATCC 38327]|eukprot:KNE55107.1 hypothetical protein AMAG_17734 [Allomyces macrogynus ATCC 38327]